MLRSYIYVVIELRFVMSIPTCQLCLKGTHLRVNKDMIRVKAGSQEIDQKAIYCLNCKRLHRKSKTADQILRIRQINFDTEKRNASLGLERLKRREIYEAHQVVIREKQIREHEAYLARELMIKQQIIARRQLLIETFSETIKKDAKSKLRHRFKFKCSEVSHNGQSIDIVRFIFSFKTDIWIEFKFDQMNPKICQVRLGMKALYGMETIVVATNCCREQLKTGKQIEEYGTMLLAMIPYHIDAPKYRKY